MDGALPKSVLFACNANAVRSPMAAALLAHLWGGRILAASVGVKRGAPDLFAAEAMREIGLDIGQHVSRTFADLGDTHADLVISLTPEAHHQALEYCRDHAAQAEYWPTLDPTVFEGSREQILSAYRGVRDTLAARLRKRFRIAPTPAG